jgi:hypothetical protein
MNLHPDVFAGEALVTNNDGKCSIMVINTAEKDLELEIPPQEIFEFDDEDSIDFFSSDTESDNFDEGKDRLKDLKELRKN